MNKMDAEDFDREKVVEIVRGHLQRDFPVFGVCHRVKVGLLPCGKQMIVYHDGSHDKGDKCTRLDLNLENGVCDIVHISLREQFRGKGYGSALYCVAEEIARELGCKKVRTDASGWMLSGEPKSEYLLRKRGYHRVGKLITVEKSLVD